ncbi:hypothetical protein [Alienimonas chondri]|uniref:Transposase IS200-like domain-containing protein n=1 Tax=Alienimonas chondri TaxID=2681879 RepID=A0ABX1VHR1_9PLAN|nr:hypothetical protein [Alienimonas chondri]NNJ27420.1 hypothetical protein [Alienimonas chondri]
MTQTERVAAGGPWRGWYHVMTNVRGAWLPGDPRGWRSYAHRDHCEGDYKNPPPPDEHLAKLRRARDSMRDPPEFLSETARTAACLALTERLLELGSNVPALCVTDRHVHALVRFCNYDADGEPIPNAAIPGLHPRNALRNDRDPAPRHLFGRAKMHASRELGDAGLKSSKALWGRRCHIKPVSGRAHQLNVYRYIIRHRERERAALWTFRDGLLPPPTHKPR